MPSTLVSAAVIRGRMLLSSMPWRTARATYSGKRTADSQVAKNLDTTSESMPLTLMSKRLSWRWKASRCSRGVPLYCSEGSHFSRTLVKLRPDSLYIPLSSFTVSK